MQVALGGDGAIWALEFNGHSFGRYTATAPATTVPTSGSETPPYPGSIFFGVYPRQLLARSDGTFWVYGGNVGLSNVLTVGLVNDTTPVTITNFTPADASSQLEGVQSVQVAFNKAVAWFGDERNRDEAINVLVVTGNLKPEEVAKSYEFFRKGGFFEPTGSVSRAKLRAVANVLISLGDLPMDISIDQLLLPGVTKVTD